MIPALTITEHDHLIAYTSVFKMCNNQMEYSSNIQRFFSFLVYILSRKFKTLWKTKIKE